MKHLKRFEGHREAMKSQFENKHHNLIGEDLSTYNYVLGISENGEINEAFGGALMDRLKKIARNGALTATVLTSLLNTPAFANEYKSMTPTEKTEIMNLVKSDSPGSETKAVEDGTLTINIGSSFKSGEYEITNVQDSKLQGELNKLQDFIKNSGEMNFKISITASESQVPNKDAKTGERLKVGQLSKLRSQSAENLVKGYINSLGINAGVNITSNTQVGTQKWQNDNARDAKYTAEQYVNIKIEIVQNPMCDFSRDYTGSVASADTDFISYEKSFDTQDMVGKIQHNIKTGSIPDRMVITGVDKTGNSVVISDSGYTATEASKYSEWKLVPAYVSALTDLSINHKDSDAIKGDKIQTVTVNSFDELINTMRNPNSGNYNIEKDTRQEVKSGLDSLKKMFNSGVRTFTIYKTAKATASFDLATRFKQVKIKVYSPVAQTGFTVSSSCAIN